MILHYTADVFVQFFVAFNIDVGKLLGFLDIVLSLAEGTPYQRQRDAFG